MPAPAHPVGLLVGREHDREVDVREPGRELAPAQAGARVDRRAGLAAGEQPPDRVRDRPVRERPQVAQGCPRGDQHQTLRPAHQRSDQWGPDPSFRRHAQGPSHRAPMRSDTRAVFTTRHPRREADRKATGLHRSSPGYQAIGTSVEAAHPYGRTFVSNRTLKRAGRAGVALAVGCAFAAVPAAAQAATPASTSAPPSRSRCWPVPTSPTPLVTSMWGDLGLYAGHPRSPALPSSAAPRTSTTPAASPCGPSTT